MHDNNYLLEAEICFTDAASKSFHFPVMQSIRISFWLEDSAGSTFSEIRRADYPITIGVPCRIQLLVAAMDFLDDKIHPGTAFSVGNYPNAIALGKVIQVDFVPLRGI